MDATLKKYSSRINQRRRSLFPENSPTNDDLLGPISPLSNSDNENEDFTTKNSIYDIISRTPSSKIIYAHSESENSMSPLYMSPTVTKTNFTPSRTLKTPHFDISSNYRAPKLQRKSSYETELAILKEKIISPISSPVVAKSHSKVRTSLFSDMQVSTKSFYSQKNELKAPKSTALQNRTVASVPTLKTRKKAKRKVFGGINAGVGHKIRKPKAKKLNNAVLLKAAENIIDNSPLNEFLDNLDSNKEKPHVKAINPLTDAEIQNDKYLKDYYESIQQLTNPNYLNKQLKLIKNTYQDSRSKRSLEIEPTFENNSKKFCPSTEFEENDESFLDDNINDLISALGENKENSTETFLNNEENCFETQIAKKASEFLSPTSQMCNMASDLAINSPKKARNLSNLLENMPNSNTDTKLFPIFYPEHKSAPQSATQSQKRSLNNKNHEDTNHGSRPKRFKALDKEQMLLDAGQKHFGATQCPECDCIYHMGDPNDEMRHDLYHSGSNVLKFHGWKNERVLYKKNGGRVIQILPTDSKIWIKKIKELVLLINRELGYYEIKLNIENSQTYLYIKNKTIAGCLIAEKATSGHRMLSSDIENFDMCSEESYPIKCGISRIWCNPTSRKQGIASKMVDCLKMHFISGGHEIMSNEEIALSSPTQDGKQFAVKYFKTPNFMTYFA